jgi:hypothetical protein
MRLLVCALYSMILATAAFSGSQAFAQAFVLDDLFGETASVAEPAVVTPAVTEPKIEEPVVAPVVSEDTGGTTTVIEDPPGNGPNGFHAANNYNIRSDKGERLCSVPKGTALVPTMVNSDRDFAKVKLNSPGCPSEGWVSVSGLQPDGGTGASMKVDVDGSLSLRSSPGAADNFLCNLPDDQAVAVIGGKPATDIYRAWVKVSMTNAPSGCPGEGWVHSEYLKPADELIASLPVDANAFTSIGEEGNTEAQYGSTCPGCSSSNIKALQDVVSGVRSMGNLSSWRKARGMVQIPTGGSSGHIGPCGTFHYNPNSPAPVNGKLVDNYANPTTACVMMAIAQEWKSRYPSTSSGKRFAWGDISHPTLSRFNRHKSHTDGNCFDMRPMRKGAFKDEGLEYGWSNYDRAAT